MDSPNEYSREERYRRYCDERIAQQIRENSQELRELESKIRAIYVNKTVQCQLAEREKKRLEEKIQLENEIKRMKQQEHEEFIRNQQQKQEVRLRKAQHCNELQEQIAQKQIKQKILYEEFLKEKHIIDEIMEQLHREQIEEMQERLQKAECLKGDILRLIDEQRLWKMQQVRLAAEENEKITKYIEEQNIRLDQMKRFKKEKLVATMEMQDKMCSQLNKIEKEKLEREDLMIEIKSNELQEKQIILDRQQLAEKIRQRMRTKLELEKQVQDLERRRMQRKDEEEQFKLSQLKLLAEQDRLEMLTKERQRVKRHEHHRIVKELLADRERARGAEVVELIQEQNEIIAMEKRRQEIFADERRKILQQHADDIIGFLPRELIES